MQICASYGVSTPYGIDTAAADIQSGAGQRSIHSWLIRILLETDYAINSQLDPLRALVEICYARIFTVEFLNLVSGRFLFTTKGGKVGMSTLAVL